LVLRVVAMIPPMWPSRGDAVPRARARRRPGTSNRGGEGGLHTGILVARGLPEVAPGHTLTCPRPIGGRRRMSCPQIAVILCEPFPQPDDAARS
jgi:hypothetical protein